MLLLSHIQNMHHLHAHQVVVLSLATCSLAWRESVVLRNFASCALQCYCRLHNTALVYVHVSPDLCSACQSPDLCSACQSSDVDICVQLLGPPRPVQQAMHSCDTAQLSTSMPFQGPCLHVSDLTHASCALHVSQVHGMLDAGQQR